MIYAPGYKTIDIKLSGKIKEKMTANSYGSSDLNVLWHLKGFLIFNVNIYGMWKRDPAFKMHAMFENGSLVL